MWDFWQTRIEYEIEMTKIEALDQPGSRCEETFSMVPKNLAFCIEETLYEKVNCSLGMMARVYDNKTVCNRRQGSTDSARFDIINDSKFGAIMIGGETILIQFFQHEVPSGVFVQSMPTN